MNKNLFNKTLKIKETELKYKQTNMNTTKLNIHREPVRCQNSEEKLLKFCLCSKTILYLIWSNQEDIEAFSVYHRQIMPNIEKEVQNEYKKRVITKNSKIDNYKIF